jgi:hypothetical protein
VADADLRVLLETFDPKVRHDLRRILIRDQADREVIAWRVAESIVRNRR